MEAHVLLGLRICIRLNAPTPAIDEFVGDTSTAIRTNSIIEMTMETEEKTILANCETCTLLFVADVVTGSPDVLDFACELAERQNARLQLLQVIDPEHAFSSPDAQMGSQYSLEMLTQNAKRPKRCAVSLLSFGCPEKVIPRRAEEVNASLVILPLNGSASDRVQKSLVRRLRGKCDCPVLAVPRDLFRDRDANSRSIRALLARARRVCEGDRQSMRGLVRASAKAQSQAPLVLIPASAHFLGRQSA